MTGDWRDGGTFRDRLARFVLEAYAAGERVHGEWYLADADPLVPTLVVAIERVGGDPPRTSSTARTPTDVKPHLQSFLLEEYGAGADIDGEWTLRYANQALPSWRVEIATTDAELLSREGRHNPEV